MDGRLYLGAFCYLVVLPCWVGVCECLVCFTFVGFVIVTFCLASYDAFGWLAFMLGLVSVCLIASMIPHMDDLVICSLYEGCLVAYFSMVNP